MSELQDVLKKIEKDRVTATRAMIESLTDFHPLGFEDCVIEECTGGFTLKCDLGFFVITVKKAG